MIDAWVGLALEVCLGRGVDLRGGASQGVGLHAKNKPHLPSGAWPNEATAYFRKLSAERRRVVASLQGRVKWCLLHIRNTHHTHNKP